MLTSSLPYTNHSAHRAERGKSDKLCVRFVAAKLIALVSIVEVRRAVEESNHVGETYMYLQSPAHRLGSWDENEDFFPCGSLGEVAGCGIRR